MRAKIKPVNDDIYSALLLLAARGPYSLAIDCQTFFVLLLLQFLSDYHETWHASSMCQYAKNFGTAFRN